MRGMNHYYPRNDKGAKSLDLNKNARKRDVTAICAAIFLFRNQYHSGTNNTVFEQIPFLNNS